MGKDRPNVQPSGLSLLKSSLLAGELFMPQPLHSA